MKQFFAMKLIPPRPSFAQDMSEDERKIMMQHVAYWKDLTEKGFTVVYGPVLDPNGAYGFGVVQVDSEDQVKDFIAHDPANGLNRYEYYPMLAVLPPK